MQNSGTPGVAGTFADLFRRSGAVGRALSSFAISTLLVEANLHELAGTLATRPCEGCDCAACAGTQGPDGVFAKVAFADMSNEQRRRFVDAHAGLDASGRSPVFTDAVIKYHETFKNAMKGKSGAQCCDAWLKISDQLKMARDGLLGDKIIQGDASGRCRDVAACLNQVLTSGGAEIYGLTQNAPLRDFMLAPNVAKLRALLADPACIIGLRLKVADEKRNKVSLSAPMYAVLAVIRGAAGSFASGLDLIIAAIEFVAHQQNRRNLGRAEDCYGGQQARSDLPRGTQQGRRLKAQKKRAAEQPDGTVIFEPDYSRKGGWASLLGINKTDLLRRAGMQVDSRAQRIAVPEAPGGGVCHFNLNGMTVEINPIMGFKDQQEYSFVHVLVTAQRTRAKFESSVAPDNLEVRVDDFRCNDLTLVAVQAEAQVKFSARS